jgi:hypothetical protein
MHGGRELNGGSASFLEVMSHQLCSLLERLDNRIGIETPALVVFHIGDADGSNTINHEGLRSVAFGCLAPMLQFIALQRSRFADMLKRSVACFNQSDGKGRSLWS